MPRVSAAVRTALAASLALAAGLKLGGQWPTMDLAGVTSTLALLAEMCIAALLLSPLHAWGTRALLLFCLIASSRWIWMPTSAARDCGCLGGVEQSFPSLPYLLIAAWSAGALALSFSRDGQELETSHPDQHPELQA